MFYAFIRQLTAFAGEKVILLNILQDPIKVSSYYRKVLDELFT